MDAGALFELLVVIAIIMAGLLGGKKKKPQQTPDERRREGARREEQQRQRARQAESEPRRDELFSDIERMLRGELGLPEPERAPKPAPRIPDPEEAVSLEPLYREAISLEQLEIDSAARHEAFHERYLPASPTRPAGETAWGTRPTAGRGVRLAPMNLRQAVIWREILGPPKGLDQR